MLDDVEWSGVSIEGSRGLEPSPPHHATTRLLPSYPATRVLPRYPAAKLTTDG